MASGIGKHEKAGAGALKSESCSQEKDHMKHRIVLDSNLLERFFAHIRNVFYCSLILAVGSHTHDHLPEFLRGTSLSQYWGYPLIGIGLMLFLMNLVDGLSQVLKTRYNLFVKVLLSLIVIVLTCWLVLVVWFFRVK